MNRISALDGIRGLLLILMTINHLIWMSGGQTALQLFTLQPFGQFGAAEGFIFISGLLAGLVYSSDKYSYPQLKEKAFARAFEIYQYHAISLVAVIAIVLTFMHFIPETEPLWRINMPNLLNDSVNAYFLSLLLINRPTYFDILPLYFVMMLCLPFVIAQLHQGRLWLVGLISISLWLLSSFVEQQMLTRPLTALTPSLTVNLGYFDIFAWQLLFTVGVIIGYFQRVQPINWFANKKLAWWAGLLLLVLFSLHQGIISTAGFHLYQYADKPNLGWLRVVNLGVFIYLLAFIIKKFPNSFNIISLQFIGKHSLQVFAWHSVLVYLAGPFLFQLRNSESYVAVILLLTCTLVFPAILHHRLHHRAKTTNQPVLLKENHQ
ncbi:hypothetical protein CW745_13045 [Psychromonas sp. psych-6C06]|uniref:OpgC domain-containing protein n=1 Tax=Psychromonas sp. psych-6C06 TaxID=2058089 RepID=UPI000C33FFAA|nr:OpgC domain-containing protein [Psychromonas sp. psych-6C06]PKF60795.1 hypothetical protein CW745_13045 [Psychromonas sp. psych-6C06]